MLNNKNGSQCKVLRTDVQTWVWFNWSFSSRQLFFVSFWNWRLFCPPAVLLLWVCSDHDYSLVAFWAPKPHCEIWHNWTPGLCSVVSVMQCCCYSASVFGGTALHYHICDKNEHRLDVNCDLWHQDFPHLFCHSPFLKAKNFETPNYVSN